MPPPKLDPKLSLLSRKNRDPSASGSREILADPDTPQGGHHEGYTGEALASAFRSVEQDSEAERALLAVVDLLISKHETSAGSGGSGGEVTRAFVGKLSALVLGVLTLVQPTVEQVAERMISPSSALERKLDEALIGQARLQAQQQEDRATFIALAKWVVECEIARQAGRGLPEPPAPVRLILVQDELTRTTGQ